VGSKDTLQSSAAAGGTTSGTSANAGTSANTNADTATGTDTGLAGNAGSTSPGDPGGYLKDGDLIPLSRTNRSAEVEEVFGALSLVLNGGGVAQLKTITTELNKALGGNESQVRDALTRIGTLVSDLNRQKTDITDALDSVNELASNLSTRDQQIGTVLSDLSPGLKVLDTQRSQLLTMLNSLNTLSTVAVSTVNRSKDDMVADLKALAPTLRKLADAGQALPDSLQVLATYPFTDEVLNGVKGDYLNVYLDLAAVGGTVLTPPKYPNASPSATTRSATTAPLPLPTVTTTDAGGGTS
jgi:phospholipid/cholesterol/gamma-HCH transport system substrate-binding protein